jgi:hypothetical protein
LGTIANALPERAMAELIERVGGASFAGLLSNEVVWRSKIYRKN